jgi:hypothetical protein
VVVITNFDLHQTSATSLDKFSDQRATVIEPDLRVVIQKLPSREIANRDVLHFRGGPPVAIGRIVDIQRGPSQEIESESSPNTAVVFISIIHR